ncbi:MAG: hypothetical protein OXC82_14055 [Rhodobacteraceae bacterium]|nr:hypothetical protein [Paracoccaceae bacterium]
MPVFRMQALEACQPFPYPHRGTGGDCWKTGLPAGIDGGTNWGRCSLNIILTKWWIDCQTL